MSDGMKTVKGFVAVTPFVKREVQKVSRNGFATAAHTTQLTELTVQIPCSEFEGGSLLPGDRVWVRQEVCRDNCASNVFTQGEMEFILLPVERVVAYARRRSKDAA